LGGGHLHRLLLEHELGLHVARDHQHHGGDHHREHAEAHHGPVQVARGEMLLLALLGLQPQLPGTVVVAHHVPGGDPGEEGAGHQPGARDHMGEGGHRGHVGEHREDRSLDRKSTRLNSSHVSISYPHSLPTRRSSDLYRSRAARCCSWPSSVSSPSSRARLWWRTMCQEATPVRKAPATSQAPETTWGKAAIVVTLVSTERIDP